MPHCPRGVQGRPEQILDVYRREVTQGDPTGNCKTRALPCSVDDYVPSLVNQMAQADGIIYATSVHGFGMPALMQTVTERAGVG